MIAMMLVMIPVLSVGVPLNSVVQVGVLAPVSLLAVYPSTEGMIGIPVPELCVLTGWMRVDFELVAIFDVCLKLEYW